MTKTKKKQRNTSTPPKKKKEKKLDYIWVHKHVLKNCVFSVLSGSVSIQVVWIRLCQNSIWKVG